MGRAEKRKKVGGKIRSEFQLNRSISTYGRVQTRLVTDLPNYNWLPSDDSLPIGNKPNVLTNVTNQQSQSKRNYQLQPRKLPLQNITQDSDDDFRSCKRDRQSPTRTRQEKVLSKKVKALPSLKKCKKPYQKKKPSKVPSADKENNYSINHTKCMQKRNIHYRNSDGTTQKKGKKAKQHLPAGTFHSKNEKVDFNGHDDNNQIQTVPDLAVTDASIVLGPGPSDNDGGHQVPVPTVPNLAVTDGPITIRLSDSDDNDGMMNNDDMSGLQASVIMQINNELSTDLFSSQSFKAPEIVKNPALHIGPGILQCPDGPKSPVCIHSFNSTVIGHAADFEITDASAHQLPKCHPSASSKPGLIQSTPVVNSRKLKINLITATDPRISLKDSTSASVALEQNALVDKEAKTTRRKVAKPNGNVGKLKVARRNRPKNLRKPKHFSKRLANKCNRSMRSTDNNSILQHIMLGNSIKQYQYDFLENSQDAYFVDTFSKSIEGVQLGRNEKKSTSPIQNDPTTAVETANHSSNCSVNEPPCDYIKSSDEVFNIPNPKWNFNAHCHSSKKKCLRKRARVDYKLMLSGSWNAGDFRNPPISDEVKSTNTKSSYMFPVCKNKTPIDSDRDSCDNDFKLLHHHLEQGNINQRRQRKPTKPASCSSLFSPLTRRSHAHVHSNHMESPQLNGRTHGGTTPKQSNCGIRCRSPGSHLKTPIRVYSRTHINRLKINTLSESFDKASHSLKEQSISNSILHSTGVENQSSKVVKQSLGFAKALSPVRNRSASLFDGSLTEKQKVLTECNQVEPIQFETILSGVDLHSCRKLGEGVFGEVFGIQWKDVTEGIAMKVIPIEGGLIVNDEKQKTCGEILPEILSSKELSTLSTGLDYATDGFIKLHAVHCVKGKYPESLLDVWDTYNEEECSQNDRPDSFGDDQLYILLLYSDGGTDVEHYKFRSATQAYSVIQQVCAALAVAEKTLEFEHRDLHWGNVLVTPTKSKEVSVTFDGKSYQIQTNGVKVNIIDFTLSRLSKGGVTVFQDLSSDPTIFNGDVDADYQYEIYRLMKEETQNDWSCFCPKSNIFWLHYLVMKFVKEVKYSYVKSSRHNSFLSKCRFLIKTLFDYNSCSHALFSCPKLSV